MDNWLVAAALLSALLHAGWNAAVKSSGKATEVMTGQMVGAGLIGLPILVWTGLPALAAWPWIAIATALNVVNILALLKAYELTGFGVAYPMVRASAVTIMAPLASIVTGDALSTFGIMGVGLIASSLLIIGLSSRGATAISRGALGWILLSGCGTAIVVLCEARGVRVSGSALAYGCVSAITNAAVMAWKQKLLAAPFSMLQRHWRTSGPAAVASMASYLLILVVFAQAPIAAAAALRDTSAIFAILIAIFWLREPMTRTHLAAVGLSALAIPLLRFA